MPDNSFHRDASGRLSFDLFNVPSDRYSEICDDLEPVGKVTLNPLIGQGYFVGHEQDTDVERERVPNPAHG
jgi:hypothetical protein